jgi:hypothetical protein
MHQDFKGVMRPGQNKRGRGRNHNPNNMGGQHNNNNNRGPRPPHRMQTFDSNGPSVKIRGNAYQVFERYIALAREASSSGDRIAAENLYQHAEHYYRIMQANGDGQHMAPRPMTPADTEMSGGDGEGEFNPNGQQPQQGQPQAPGQPQPMIPESASDDSEGPAAL